MRKVKVMDIIRQESERTGVPASDITGEKRTHELCHLRHYCMWRAKIETGFSYPAIGRYFGNRDHTSVLHGVKRIESMPIEERRWDPPKVKMKIPNYDKNDDMMPPKTIFPIQPIYKVA